MNLKEFFLVALESIKNNKMRSFLTMLGIIIGIAAVIAVMAIGQGGRAMVINELESFGTNMFEIYPDYNREIRYFTKEDVMSIKRNVPEVKYLAPVVTENVEIRSVNGKASVRIFGTTTDYQYIRNLDILRGRFFSQEDDAVARRVIVLDEDLAQELFGTANPIGERVVLVGAQSAVVVGVIKKKDSQLGMRSTNNAYMPITSLQGSQQWKYVYSLMGSAADREVVSQAMERAKKILERRNNVSDYFRTYSMEQEMESVNKVTGILSLVISSIAGISLLVGGIGVMNIMLVSVTERTREIGIRMALGATRRDILVQFLIEAVVLCSVGGIIGIILGYGGAWVAAQFLNLPSLVSWHTALVAFLFSMAIGVFFGIYPANKAAKLDPIVALRRE